MRGERMGGKKERTASKMENEKRQMTYGRKDNKREGSNTVIHLVFPANHCRSGCGQSSNFVTKSKLS